MRQGKIFQKKAQATAEYAVLIGLVVAAAMAMQIYIKRGAQARVYDASNKYYTDVTEDPNWSNISNVTVAPLASKQYEPTELDRQSTQIATKDDETTELSTGGISARSFERESTQKEGDYQKHNYNLPSYGPLDRGPDDASGDAGRGSGIGHDTGGHAR